MKSDLVTNLIGKYDLCSVVHYKLAAFKKVSELMILYLVVDLLNPFWKEYQVFPLSYYQFYIFEPCYALQLQENCRPSSDCKTIVPKGKQDVKCPDWKGQEGTIGNMHRLSVRDVEKINNYYACNVIKLPERGELLL